MIMELKVRLVLPDESSSRKEINSGGKAGTLEGTCTSKLNNFNMK